MIVLQGDHGQDVAMEWREPMSAWTEASFRGRAFYLSLVRAPDRCAGGLDRPLGQINTARFVLACAEGHAPEFLPEHTYTDLFPRFRRKRRARLASLSSESGFGGRVLCVRIAASGVRAESLILWRISIVRSRGRATAAKQHCAHG